MGYSKQMIDELDAMIEDSIGQAVPYEFVSAAKVTDIHGKTHIITKEELMELYSNTDSHARDYITKVNIAIDIESVRRAVLEISESLSKH